MRLGQLARQLDVSVHDIISFLEKDGVSINEHPNSKFPEEYEGKVVLNFGGKPKQETPAEEIKVPEVVEIEEHTEASVTEAANVEAETLVESHTSPSESHTSPSESEQGEVEVIKAPKIELPGLKVLGKIELPEPKPKTTEAESQAPSEPTKTKNLKGKHGKKLLTQEEKEARRIKYRAEKKKKEEWEAHKQKLREERKKKAAKAAYYETTVKQKIANKPVKKSRKKPVTSEVEIDTRPKPKTLLGKIWRWLNT